MVSVETFVEFVKNKDLGRIKFALRETHFDLDATDEEGRTALHHAVIDGILNNDLQMTGHLLAFGADVNIKDETSQKETPLHIALRMEHIEAIKLLLSSHSFDVVRVDSFQRQMFQPGPIEVAATDRRTCSRLASSTIDMEDLNSICSTASSQFTPVSHNCLVLVRQSTCSYLDNLPESNSKPNPASEHQPNHPHQLTDIVLLQDEYTCTPVGDILRRGGDFSSLTSLFVVDCRLPVDMDDLLVGLRLRTLVFSNTHLRRLPSSLFDIDCLEVLKIDRNSLDEVPVEISRLSSLQVFCCDRQRPRLRFLPQCISKMQQLQVLSVSNNRLDDLCWVVGLQGLRVLRCDRNRISRLPLELTGLRNLQVLDVSHNRLASIPAAFNDLISRLYRFDYFNVTLRPRYVQHDRSQLSSHLELEHFLANGVVRPTVRDISVALVGESLSGKSTLAEYFNQDRLGPGSGIAGSSVELLQSCTDILLTAESAGDSSYVSAVELSNSVMDNCSRNINADLYMLVVDLTTIQPHNGCQHLFARHISRLQMWLQALYELSPDTPVVLVGTHADQVRSVLFPDIWATVERLLEHGRTHHVKRYADARLGSCLLCNRRSQALRRTFTKCRSAGGPLGFVDMSFPFVDSPPPNNGHLPMEERHAESGGPKHRYPHVIAYYEVDAKKLGTKTKRKSSYTVDQLKEAVIRLTSSMTKCYRIPRNWVNFIRHANNRMTSSTVDVISSSLPFISYEEAKCIAKNCDVVPTQLQHMLHYFHRRGKLVYFGGDDMLSRLVVINASWFMHRLSHLMDVFERSRCSSAEVLQALADREVEGQLQKRGSEAPPVGYTRWLLAALQKLEMCIMLQSDVAPASSSSSDEKLYLLPNLLEYGSPSHDVWPDNPEWEEKQITCDFGIRSLKPGLFTDLILRINREGRRYLKIVPDPVPVFLSHHVVFFSALDEGGCEDCYNFRRRIRAKQKFDDASDDTADDVLHKVHIMFHSRMDAVRLQVRGVSPCCTMKAVLNFLELFLDDLPEEDYESSSDGASFSSQTTSSASPSASASALYSSDGLGSFGSLSHGSEDDDDRDLFLLCPKCVLLRHTHPGRIAYHCISPKRKAICRKWHNLGSWNRAVTGDYRFSSVIEVPPAASLTMLPDYEHPRLVLILPPSPTVSNKDWYMFSKMKFLEGFEVHFLCEYTGYWHITEDAGYRLNQSAQFTKKIGNQIPVLLNLALPLIQVIQGIPEHANNGRLVAPVVADLIKVYEYLRSADPHIHDTFHWLTKNKDRVVNMLTKVLSAAGDGMPDLYFKVNNSINAHAIFQSASTANRYQLARFLRIDASSGRFGSLRPLYVEREIRWVCESHYEELRNAPV